MDEIDYQDRAVALMSDVQAARDRVDCLVVEARTPPAKRHVGDLAQRERRGSPNGWANIRKQADRNDNRPQHSARHALRG